MKNYILVALAVGSTASMLQPVDLSGQWVLRMDPDYQGNQGAPVDCSFKQHGPDLTVKCGTGSEMKGKVHGRTATWGFEKTSIPPKTEDLLVVTHTAEANQAGTELKGSWRLTSGVADRKGNLAAKKKR